MGVADQVDSTLAGIGLGHQELLASNEELQSTNEELQSVNEELFTVNAEYQKKIAELTELNNDIDNLFQITDIGKVFLDAELRVRKFTPAVIHSVNLMAHDVGRPIAHISHNLLEVDLLADVKRVQQSGERVARDVQTTGQKWMQMRVIPYLQESGASNGVIVTFVDVTELKRTEAALRESEARYQDLYDNAPDLFASLDTTGGISTCNMTFVNMLQYTSKAEIIGRSIFEFIASDALDDARAAFEEFRRTGQSSNVVQRLLRRDGSVLDAILNASAVRDAAGKLLYSRSAWRDHTAARQAADDRRRHLQERELDRAEIERQAECLRQHAAELQRRNDELARSNKDLDDFANIASHDLKEPLHAVRFYCTLLLEDYGDRLDESGRDKLQTLVRQVSHMDAMVDSLHQFSQLGRFDLNARAIDMNELITRVIDSLHLAIESSSTEIVIARDFPTITCDPAVAEVWRNLVTNAIKYNDKPRKHIEIGWRPAQGTEPGAERKSPVFFVRDNGIGIKRKDYNKIFDIFRRLHATGVHGGGTGVGLTFARRIIERHGGQIWLESTVGSGTTFYFTLDREPA